MLANHPLREWPTKCRGSARSTQGEPQSVLGGTRIRTSQPERVVSRRRGPIGPALGKSRSPRGLGTRHGNAGGTPLPADLASGSASRVRPPRGTESAPDRTMGGTETATPARRTESAPECLSPSPPPDADRGRRRSAPEPRADSATCRRAPSGPVGRLGSTTAARRSRPRRRGPPGALRRYGYSEGDSPSASTRQHAPPCSRPPVFSLRHVANSGPRVGAVFRPGAQPPLVAPGTPARRTRGGSPPVLRGAVYALVAVLKLQGLVAAMSPYIPCNAST